MTILFTYLFWQSCLPPGMSSQTSHAALFVNMVFSDKDKILIKKLYQLKRDIMRDNWGQNFRSKDGWQVALTGCLISSETRAQLTNVRAATDCEVPTWMKTLTRWTIWFWVKRTSPTSTVREISQKTGIPKSSVVRIIRKDLQLKCFKRRRVQELTEAHCTAGKLLLKSNFNGTQFV